MATKQCGTRGRECKSGLGIARAAVAMAGLTVSLALSAATFELESTRWDDAKPAGGVAGAFSSSGRYVVFTSDSAAVVSGDTNGLLDVFLRDRETGTTSRISVSSTGAQANGPSAGDGMSVTPDGRYVSFYSGASNLVAGDTNNHWDVFVRDTVAGTTERVSISSAGVQGNDSSYVSFLSDDGRFVLFNSAASNLIAAQTHADNIYVRDRLNRTTRLVGVADSTTSCYAGGFSADGTLAAFTCESDDLYVRNLTDGSLEQVTYPHGTVVNTDVGDLSADGRYLAFSTDAHIVAADTNGESVDAYLYDRATKTFDLVSVNKQGVAANNGSNATSVSDDGRYVAFSSWATDIEGDDGVSSFDGFVRDRIGQRSTRVTGSPYGACCMEGDFAISGDGGAALFSSDGRFVPNDFNDRADVMVATNLFAPPTAFTVRPRSLAFGIVAVGSMSAPQPVTITNTGGADLAIAWVGLAGADATQFSRVRNCPAVLRAGESCVPTVQFVPTSVGSQAARLVVSAGGTRKSSAVSGFGQ